MTKNCPQCKIAYPLMNFYNNKASHDGLSAYCKSCAKEKAYAWRKVNKAYKVKYRLDYNRLRVARLQALVNVHKSKPCADCGASFPPVCMDFDHMPGFEKCGNVSSMIHNFRPIEEIEAEISKCELVCANCHRVRTILRLHDNPNN